MPETEPKQARAFETRRRILEAAAAAFARDGFDGTSLNRVIRESGLTKGAFYFHFASKEALAHAAFRFKQEQLVAQTLAEVGEQPDAAAQLAEVIRARSRIYRHDPAMGCIPRLGSDLGSRVGPDSEFARFQELAIEAFAAIVRRGRREGLFRWTLDPRAAAEDIFAALIGMDRVSQWVSGGSDLEDRTEHLIDVLLNGLAARSRRSSARRGGRRS